jgi:hypothetical protein
MNHRPTVSHYSPILTLVLTKDSQEIPNQKTVSRNSRILTLMLTKVYSKPEDGKPTFADTDAHTNERRQKAPQAEEALPEALHVDRFYEGGV